MGLSVIFSPAWLWYCCANMDWIIFVPPPGSPHSEAAVTAKTRKACWWMGFLKQTVRREARSNDYGGDYPWGILSLTRHCCWKCLSPWWMLGVASIQYIPCFCQVMHSWFLFASRWILYVKWQNFGWHTAWIEGKRSTVKENIEKNLKQYISVREKGTGSVDLVQCLFFSFWTMAASNKPRFSAPVIVVKYVLSWWWFVYSRQKSPWAREWGVPFDR